MHVAENVEVLTTRDRKATVYAMLVLEMGLLFENMLQAIKVPNRPRMLRTLKLVMCILKAKSNNSKYADEILRFLVQQLYTLSERDAHEVFYGMFVNTRGNIDTHIAADLQMEHIVNIFKRHIKHMHSNKTEKNIARKSESIAGVSAIARNYDNSSHVAVKAKKHSNRSSTEDELIMIEDINSIHTFSSEVGDSDNNPSNRNECFHSNLLKLNSKHFHEWIHKRAKKHATSLD